MGQNSFGYWLRLKRKALDLTREGLAGRIGYSAASICKIEAEERRPSAQLVERLADIFNVPPNERTAFLKFARGDWKSVPGDAAADEPWRISARVPYSNLPAATTSLIGREQEIKLVCEYLLNNDIRLVTLIGPPGIGKTRLSIAAARAALPYFHDHVFFVVLDSLGNPDLLAPTIAQTLGYVATKNLSANEQLIEGIGEKQILLVLDNCEHLIEAVAALAGELLSTCPQLKILATSRESLRIAGEWLFPVPVLKAPKDQSSIDMLHTAEYSALTLFSERARTVRSDFALDNNNIAAVSSICAQLDGLPLAIELIAARIRLMSPLTLLENLTAQSILSADGMRAGSARQKTLKHAIGWSYNLLSVEEQGLFACLSVFSGGFTIKTAEAIFSRKIKERSISGLITSLLDKSLLQCVFEESHGEVRFSMLVTIQQFALECLRNTGGEAEIRNWHMMYYSDLALKADHEIHGPHQIEWLELLHLERANLRAALEWMIDTEQTETALKMARNLAWFWFIRSDLYESRRWLGLVVTLPDAPRYPESYADALSHFANHARYQTRAKEPGLFFEQALTVARAHQDKHNTAQTLLFLGKYLAEEHDFITAQTILEESKALFRELGDEWEESAHVILAMALGPYLQKDWATSLALHQYALTGFRKFGDIFFQMVCLRFIGHLQAKLGEIAQGMTALREALIFAQQLDSKHEIAAILWVMGEASQSTSNFNRAVRLYGAAKQIDESVGVWQQDDEEKYGNNLGLCRVGLDETEFAAALEQSSKMTTEQGGLFALAECES